MRAKHSVKNWLIFPSMAAAAAVVAHSATSYAYPIDPNKTPVDVIQDADLNANFTLAYDSDNPNVVYYAPKGGRAATMNGQPLIGFAVLPSGKAYLNAQFEYGVFGADREKLFKAIDEAGMTPVQFPFRRTKVVPLTPEINPETGEPVCEMVYDPILDQEIEECYRELYDVIRYSSSGPTLGENIAVTAVLTEMGAWVFEDLLKQGNALQLLVTGEYYAAGTAFEATVHVNYDRLFKRFEAKGVSGILWGRHSVQTVMDEEGLCLYSEPEDCAVYVTYRDLNTGKVVDTATVDPDNEEEQREMLQAVERLRQQLQDEMLTPITPELAPIHVRPPIIGWRVKAQFERHYRGMNATFTFKSSRSVNLGETVFPVSIGCVDITDDGYIERATGGDCDLYWSGTPQ